MSEAFPVLCVTHRKLCAGDFLARIEEIAACRPAGILLREKDLAEEAYEILAAKVQGICRKYGTPLIAHSFPDAAIRLGIDALHLPLPALRMLEERKKARFRALGASCHSLEDVQEARRLGCTYLVAGHIYATECKQGAEPRGLAFLRDACVHAVLPVYAIGGIRPERLAEVREAGARGACIMSGWMQCKDAREFARSIKLS